VAFEEDSSAGLPLRKVAIFKFRAAN